MDNLVNKSMNVLMKNYLTSIREGHENAEKRILLS